MLAGLPVVDDVRGAGFFYGIELATGAQRDFLEEARRRQLVLYPFNGFRPGGLGEGVVVAPPLTSSDAELEWLVGRLADTAASLSAAGSPRSRQVATTGGGRAG